MNDDVVDQTNLTGEQIGSAIPWLKSLLESHRLVPHPSSDIAKAFRAMEQFHVDVAAGKLIRLRDERDFDRCANEFSQVSGVDFLSKALRRTWGRVRGAEEHLHYLCSQDPLPTTPTARSGDRVKERNCLWELALAALTAAVADDVALEDPPDVVFSFGGRRLGLAAKYLYSDKVGKQAERIKEGAKQLEDADVEAGFIVVNLVQRFPLGAMLQKFARNGATPTDVLSEVDDWSKSFFDGVIPALPDAFRERPKALAMLSFIPVVCPFEGGLAPMYRVSVTSIDGREAAAAAFIQAFHAASQTVLVTP